MNKHPFTLLIAVIACAPIASPGQTPSPAPLSTPAPAPSVTTPPVPAPRGREVSALLTPGERAALMAAAKKARQDPAVVAAAAKMHQAILGFDDAMLAKDKSIGPVIDKIKAASSPGAPRPHLTAEEVEQLRSARVSMMGAPETDAWKQATEDYRAAMRQAMIAADPSMAAILAKLHEGAGPGAPRTVASPAMASPSASPSAAAAK